ncbi:M48 family metallopeptidase [Campylobacter sp. JMF_01 NE2]|uniref:M48 family metallopeptidase n=1 Tax=unclassified Campylobacter TaxID=2593542 RepID=UPI0022E9D651|nr:MULTISPECIES: M48 family metallopeptidase [unclassified Campylobacter]MDA3052584.1 M48 family metallopeptidase [Campylobacter sp. JMF_03 NE3]MDA3066916.1 M48 family metallopeptidase [Campylobacter sp. JMF_01 NE2]
MAKFIPSQNEGEQNYSKENHAINFLALGVGLVAVIACVFFALNIFVGVAVKFIPEGKEYKIFKASESERVIEPKHERLVRQIRTLTSRLNSCAKVKNEYFIVINESKIPNASAALNGALTVNTGLFSHIKSENGLAFVLAHELAHFKHRDHIKGLGNGAVMAILFGFSDERLSQILGGAIAGKYSRSQEAAADSEALRILNCAYGHIGGADEFFASAKKLGDSDTFINLFESHPLLQKRIDAIKSSNFSVENTIKLNENLSEVVKFKR